MSEYETFPTIECFIPGDPLGLIFEPDSILPEQFFDSAERGVVGGERKLMAAILSDGIEAFVAHASKGTLAQSEAGDWVTTRDLSYVFSFDSVCYSLGIDPDYLRRGLNRYVENLQAMALGGEEQGRKRVWKKIRRPRK